MRGLRVVMLAALLVAGSTALAASAGHAKVSGANGRIAYAAFDPASGHGNTLMYTANPDGSDRKLLLPTDSCCAAWSPDGRRLAVAAAAPGGRITTAVLDSDGSGLSVKDDPRPDPEPRLLGVVARRQPHALLGLGRRAPEIAPAASSRSGCPTGATSGS